MCSCIDFLVNLCYNRINTNKKSIIQSQQDSSSDNTIANWLQGSTKNPFKLIKRKLLREFVGHIQDWEESGRISCREKEEVFDALNKPETQTYLDLFIQQNILSLIVRAEVLAVLGGILTGGVGLLYGALFGEGFKMLIKNIHAQIICRKIPFKKRQKVAAATMPMAIGAFTPLLFIHKDHPVLYRYFRIYFKARKFYSIVDHHKNGSKPFSWIEKQYLKHNLGEVPITPENIHDLERGYFDRLLEKFNVEKHNEVSPELVLAE